MIADNNSCSREASIKTLEERRKNLETSAQTNRNLFAGCNFVLIVALVLCLNVTDEDLLLIASSGIKLPLLNISLPIWAFACFAPLVIVALHFDLLHNLNEHRNKLMVWSKDWLAVDPTTKLNTDMPQELYPFLFDFAWLHANHTGSTAMHTRLLPGLCWLLYCWAPYTVLVVFFIRFADLQQYSYTSLHLLLLSMDALVLYWYWPGFTQNSKLSAWPKTLIAIAFAPLCKSQGQKWQELLLWLSSISAMWTLILFALIQAHIYGATRPLFIIKQVLTWEERFGFSLAPRLSLVGFRLTLPNDFSADTKSQQSGNKVAELWQEAHHTLNLPGRRLAFANFSFAQMPHSNLSYVQLQEANLKSAQLQGANFEFVHLQGALLERASLQGANLKSAQMQGVNLENAMLQCANLEFAQLQAANLEYAQLQGANLKFAHLQAAHLGSAQLQGADFASADLEATLLINSHLKGAILSIKQLKFSWIEQLEWQQSYDFNSLKKASWAQPETIQSQLEQAQQQVKSFKHLKSPSPVDNEIFAIHWLGLLCKEEAIVTKAMLGQLHLLVAPPISKARAKQYLTKHKECIPYRNIMSN